MHQKGERGLLDFNTKTMLKEESSNQSLASDILTISGHCTDQFLFLHLLKLPLRQAILSFLKREGSGITVNRPKDWRLILRYPYLCIALYDFSVFMVGQMAHMCSTANFKAWWLILPMESPRRRVSGHPVRCCLDYLTWYGKSHLSCGWDRIWAGHSGMSYMRQTSWAPACMTLQLPWLRVQCDQRSRPWCPGLSPWCTIFWTMS